jgi:UDP-N-acetyl-2-amino-2-deoxyglucuronate dehydrogenase
MSNPVRFALIGTGNIAGFHAEAIKQVPAAQLVAAFSRGNPGPFAKKYGCAAVTSLDELLARPDVDAVCITTPSGAHGDPAIAAMKAGKHVLCEKPLEITAQRIDAMLACAKETGRILAAVFQSRFGQGAQTVKRAVDAGRFGRITLASAYIKWWRTQEYYDSGAWRGTWELDGGGALMNQGIHAIDLLQWLVGMPVEVKATTATLAHERIAVEDTAVAALRYESGGLGVIEGATSAFPGWTKRIELSGDKGSVILEDDTIKFWQFAEEDPGDEAIRHGSAGGANIGGGAANPMAISTEGHRRQIEDLCGAIHEGRQPAIAGSDARRAVSLITAIYESARTGRPATPA